jgi:hypothetical protein
MAATDVMLTMAALSCGERMRNIGTFLWIRRLVDDAEKRKSAGLAKGRSETRRR